MTNTEKMAVIDRLSAAVYQAAPTNESEMREFIRALTSLVYDYKMLGIIYDFYDENITYYKQSGIELHGIEEIVRNVNELLAAFPDLEAQVDHIIVSKQSEDFYKIFRRVRYFGHNLGFSPHGPATGKSLGNRCLNLTMMHLKRIGGTWKIVFEVNSDSEALLRRTQMQ